MSSSSWVLIKINTLGLTDLVSDALGSRKQKEAETNAKIVDLLKHALDETKNCRNEQQRVEFHISLRRSCYQEPSRTCRSKSVESTCYPPPQLTTLREPVYTPTRQVWPFSAPSQQYLLPFSHDSESLLMNWSRTSTAWSDSYGLPPFFWDRLPPTTHSGDAALMRFRCLGWHFMCFVQFFGSESSTFRRGGSRTSSYRAAR
jgi:hypothetical protein